MYEKSSMKRNKYRYHGPPKPFRAIMIRAKAITATNNNFVIVFTSISRRPTLERGAELFITDLVSVPEMRIWG
jgi:hypothetical protein